MTWIENLLFTTESVAHTVFLYAFVIALGVYLGKIKFFGISLGVTFVLFVGIVAGHFGFVGEEEYHALFAGVRTYSFRLFHRFTGGTRIFLVFQKRRYATEYAGSRHRVA